MSQKEYYNKPEKEWDPCTAMPGVYAYDSPENVKIDMHPMPNKGYPQIPTYEDIYTEPSKSNNVSNNVAPGMVEGIQKATVDICAEYSKLIGHFISFLIFAAYTVYFVIACLYHSDKALALIILTAFAAFCFIYTMIKRTCGKPIYEKCLNPLLHNFNRAWPYLKWVFLPAVIIGLIYYLT